MEVKIKNILILCILFFFSLKTYAAIPSTRITEKVKNQNILIAIIDTGADIKHKELKNFIWNNEGETGVDLFGHDKSTNGIDDDNNGFVDDIHGWNFVDDTNNVTDFHGHGTHITGIIKTQFQNHTKSIFKSDSSSAKFMILKYYDPKASDSKNIIYTVKAIEYAVKMKATLINYSGGGSDQNLNEYLAIKKAAMNKILFIAAAGNNNSNTDNKKYYPANYELNNIISVAATDSKGELLQFSNYGPKSIDIAAPGKSIYSTLPNNSFGFMSGTSQSTAYITGWLAGLIYKNNTHKLNEILVDLLSFGKFNKSLKNKTKFQLALLN